MTPAAATAQSAPSMGAAVEPARRAYPGELERLTSLLDVAFPRAIGWDAAAQAFTPPPEHQQLGYTVCLVVGCDTPGDTGSGLCASCRLRYQASGRDLAAFTTVERVRCRASALSTPSRSTPCGVASCPRPAKNAVVELCTAHNTQRRQLSIPVATFVRHPQAHPLPPLGECRVAACAILADNRRGLCRTMGRAGRSTCGAAGVATPKATSTPGARRSRQSSTGPG